MSLHRLLSILFALLLISGGAIALDVSYSYDLLGRVIRVDYPSGNSVLYAYDAAGNRTTVSSSALPGAPTAVPDSASATGAGSITFDSRINDSDPNSYSLTVIAVGAAAHGTAAVSSGGASITYTPAMGYSGTDSFFYTISNGHSGQATALDTITVTAPPPPPVANPDAVTILVNTPYTFDPRTGDTGTGIVLTGTPIASNGAVVNNSGTSFTYTPNTDYVGADSFSYTITDSYSRPASSMVSVTVKPVPPVANPDSVTTSTNTPVIFDPRTNDTGNGIVLTGTPTASHGTVVNNSGASFTYTPVATYAGADSFSYTITDVASQTASSTVSITVTCFSPCAPDRSYDYPNPPASHTFDPRYSSSYAITAISTPSDGAATISSDMTSITYTASTDFPHGDVSFTYTVTDSTSHSATGNIYIHLD